VPSAQAQEEHTYIHSGKKTSTFQLFFPTPASPNPRVSKQSENSPEQWLCKPELAYPRSSSYSEQVLFSLLLIRLLRSDLPTLSTGYTGTILVKNGKLSDLIGELQVHQFFSFFELNWAINRSKDMFFFFVEYSYLSYDDRPLFFLFWEGVGEGSGEFYGLCEC